MMQSCGSVALERSGTQMQSLLDQPGDPSMVTYINLFSKKYEVSEKLEASPEFESIPPSSHYQTPPMMPLHTPINHRSKSNSPEKCKFFLKGYCLNGVDCQFSHISPNKLDVQNLNKIQNRKKRKNEPQPQICEHFLLGRCKFGSSCYKVHLVGGHSMQNSGGFYR